MSGGSSRLPAEGRRLLDFARAARSEAGGFGWLDDRGRPMPGAPMPSWITSRMTYVFSLASLLDVAWAADWAEHGVRALRGEHRDPVRGGWYESLLPDGSGPADDGKGAYAHAFVALAAATATAAGIPGARDLLTGATEVVESRFLDADGRVVERYDPTFAEAEPYRGANASMHMVEAQLVLGDVLAEPAHHETALRIAEHLIHGVAREHDFLLPEHFSADWQPDLDYNSDRRDDPFRPYGCTPGHLLEWSRLLVQLDASLPRPPSWLLEDAQELFATAVRVGWTVDGQPGFVYTVDWEGAPVVRARMHWVVAEAIAAASALSRSTGDPSYEAWFDIWWAFADEHLVDPGRGSWHHELDARNRPAATVWKGKPDVYHAFQATLLPNLRLAPSAAIALQSRRGLTDGR